MKKSHSLYVMISHTNTLMGKFIRSMTGQKYNHISLSTNKDLSSTYSFARYRKCAAFVGGFTEESSLRYMHDNKKHTKIILYKIDLSPEEYDNYKKYMDSIIKDKEEYIYNTFSAIGFFFKRRIMLYRSFTCVEFATKVLSELGVIPYINPNDSISIPEIQSLLKDFKIFEGNHSDVAKYGKDWGNDAFSERLSFPVVIKDSLLHFIELFKRSMRKKA